MFVLDETTLAAAAWLCQLQRARRRRRRKDLLLSRLVISSTTTTCCCLSDRNRRLLIGRSHPYIMKISEQISSLVLFSSHHLGIDWQRRRRRRRKRGNRKNDERSHYHLSLQGVIFSSCLSDRTIGCVCLFSLP